MTESHGSYYVCGSLLSANFLSGQSPVRREFRKYRKTSDPKDADVLVASITQQSSKDFWRVVTPRHIRLLLADEATCPDFNSFDYATGFDTIDFGPRYIRLHPAFRFRSVFPAGWVEGSAEIEKPVSFHDRKFCDFIYSNPVAHPRRDLLLNVVNSYRQVDSLGHHLNNAGSSILRSSRLSRKKSSTPFLDQKIRAQKGFRFSIAAENSLYDGYTSEKIISALLAGQVPIFWGNPSIGADFNPARFIDVLGFEDDAHLLQEIRRIDANREVWESMVREPWYTSAQEELLKENPTLWANFLEAVFKDGQRRSPRRGVGTFSDLVELRNKPGLGSQLRVISSWLGRKKNSLAVLAKSLIRTVKPRCPQVGAAQNKNSSGYENRLREIGIQRKKAKING